MTRTAVLTLALLLSADAASAQVVRPGYPVNPYNPYVNPYAYPGAYGSALSGKADVMNAYGNTLMNQEQARVIREQSNQAKIDTRKKAFDQMLYEKANTPSYLEELTQKEVQTLNRLMSYPTKSEVHNGTTLNYMLPLMRDLADHGSQGPPVPLQQSMVNQLNIAGSTGSSVGMLRAGGALDWPPSLRGPHQAKLDKLLPAACSATVAGTLSAKQLKEIRVELMAIRERLRTQLQKDEIESSAYFAGLTFHESLTKSVNALERPDARKQLSGGLSPRARNVQELTDFMIDQGAKFGPATPGTEDAYQSTHDAFVRFARRAQSSSGLQVVGAPIAAPIAAPSSKKN
jgi:hypothetical protein